MIYAHSLQGRDLSEWETLEAHAHNVAAGSSNRSQRFGASDWAALLGYLHDLGKVKPGFQAKLLGANNDTPHSAEGARFLADRFGAVGSLLAPTILGHHGHLPNPANARSRLTQAEQVAAPDWLPTQTPAAPRRLTCKGITPRERLFRAQFLVRMLYSCLTDADDRETAAFYDRAEGRSAWEGDTELIPDHLARFTRHMTDLQGDGDVNDLRRQVLRHVVEAAGAAPGAFTMTVPTGGGKTLTSLGFGLHHAAAHGLRRLVYVIPYTSIVEQTADVFRQVLGSDAVLEHHAAFDWDGQDESEAEQLKIAAQCWDRPVIVTTAVQFFESLFAARKKRCRKLHSLAGSVIVIDEAQTMPLAYLRPCLAALNEMMDGYGASVVLTTATQPALTRAGGFPAPEAFEGARELAPDPPELYRRLRRVRVRDIGEQDDAALVDHMRTVPQVLLIVDNRLQARGLFDSIRDAPGARHLSTLMTTAHRRAVLAGVRSDLVDKRPVRLVSTSLIEAGVDVSFPRVLRAAAGIDSVAQAAGRCNRHGEMEGLGEVLIFRSEHPAPDAVEQFAAIGRAVLAEHADDPIALDAVAAYFRRLWDTYGAEALDSAPVGQQAPVVGILNAIAKSEMAIPYEDIADAFRLIGQEQRSVVIRDGHWGVDASTLEDLRWRMPGTVARALQEHSVNVPFGLWRSMWAEGVLDWWERDTFGEQFAMLTSSGLYDAEAGLGIAGLETAGGVF